MIPVRDWTVFIIVSGVISLLLKKFNYYPNIFENFIGQSTKTPDISSHGGETTNKRV